MAIKNYLTQAGKNGSQKSYKNGGQDDIITATDDELSGFGYIISGGGGDDSIFGSEFDRLVEVEDPTDPTMTIMVVGGDVLIGGTGGDFIEGGGGDDTIFGGKENGSDKLGSSGATSNTLFGEMRGIFLDSADVTGGNDVLFAGNDVDNFMFGDVQSVNGPGTFTGGDDVLISGTGNDTMVGDWSSVAGTPTLHGGEDTFVFGASNGNDTIVDFRTADGDKINLFDTGLTSFADLSGFISDGPTDTVIDLGLAIGAGAIAGDDTITVQGVTGLVEADFEFIDWMEA